MQRFVSVISAAVIMAFVMSLTFTSSGCKGKEPDKTPAKTEAKDLKLASETADVVIGKDVSVKISEGKAKEAKTEGKGLTAKIDGESVKITAAADAEVKDGVVVTVVNDNKDKKDATLKVNVTKAKS